MYSFWDPVWKKASSLVRSGVTQRQGLGAANLESSTRDDVELLDVNDWQNWKDSYQNLGQPSKIADHCRERIQKYGGDKEHLWVCSKKGKRYIAQDIVFKDDDEELGIVHLRKHCGWFKRYVSLYSVVAVKEVKIRFLSIRNRQIIVCLKDFQYGKEKQNYEKWRAGIKVEGDCCGFVGTHGQSVCRAEINRQEFELGDDDGADNQECEVCYEIHDCKNYKEYEPAYIYDDADRGGYCLMDEVYRRKVIAEEEAWLSSMLEYFWQNGIRSEGKEFLNNAKFIYYYSQLTRDTHYDALRPFGKEINAFLLVEGWNLLFLLFLILGCISFSICIAAVVTATVKSLEAGVGAASYTIGVGAVAIAFLTFLSAVL